VAFRRFVWRRAQIALEDTTIWDAVEQLAEFLNDEYWPEDEEVGTHEGWISGREARAFLKRAGIHPYMELPNTAQELCEIARIADVQGK